MKKKNMEKKGNSSAKRIPFPVGFTALILLFLIFVFVAVCIGSAHLSIRDALHLILSKLPGIGQFVQTQGINEVYEQILFQVRLPRVLLAGLVGMGLSVTGTAFQGLFRNPLADPHILGVSSGAALGATLAMLFGAGTWVGGISLTGLFAFAGGLSTVFVVYRIACVGGGSNAMGSFYHFIEDAGVRLIGCEAAGRGINTFETAATISTGRLGIFHGMKSYFCQDKFGQIAPVYSISAGLDYPGIGPEHAWLHDTGRAEYVPITDEEAVNAFEYLSRTEGIIPAIESAHAIAYAMKIAPKMAEDKIIVITISGRGDKDCAAIARYRGEDIHE